MPSMDELYTALRNADAAGDTAAAQRLAAHIQSAKAITPAAAPEQSTMASIGDGLRNLGAGAVRGAGSIGATLMWPIDKATDMIQGDRGPNIAGLVSGKQPLSRNEERRAAMDSGLQYITGADPESWMYKGGKLAGEIAGTAGAGGVLAQGAARVGMAPSIVNALASGGFRTGSAVGPGLGARAADMAVRTAGGAGAGAASAGMVDPENFGLGALAGGALPGALKLTGAVGGKVADGVSSGAQRLMQSAIKPTIAQLRSGDATTAVEMMLKYGINPTNGGVGKLRGLVDDLNDQIGSSIANSGASIDKSKVAQRLDDVRTKFGNQVSPTADLNAIQSTADDFMNHPGFIGDQIPVSAAQAMKQGTYRVLAKKYGQMGSADIEAQKALARGLKDEIAGAVPGIGALNAEESKLLAALGVTERRAMMELNKNPMGLAALAQSPASWAMFMADKSALFKSMSARMLNSIAAGTRSGSTQIGGMTLNPFLRNPAALPGVRGDGE